jgi:hypothetical protein
VKIRLNIAGNDPCAAFSVNWSAYAWAGAPGPASQSFSLTSVLPANPTTWSPNCRIEFYRPPTDALSGTFITSSPFNPAGEHVKVRLVPPLEGAIVSVSALPTGCAIADASAPATTVDGVAGIAEFATLKSTATAAANPKISCTLTARVPAAPGYHTADTTFDVRYNGTLGCEDVSVSDPSGAQVTGNRIDGACGTEVPYALFWQQNKLKFYKDDPDQAAVTIFTITWPDAPAPTFAQGGFNAIPLSKQQFQGNDPAHLPDLNLCVGTAAYDDAGLLIGLSPQSLPDGVFPDLDTIPDNGQQYGCVYDRQIILLQPPPGTQSVYRLIEKVYLQGDWGASRN